MRRVVFGVLIAAAACSGGGGAAPSRGGELIVTRSSIAGAPGQSVEGYAAFFRPPGPPEPAALPRNACVTQTPAPTPTATPEVAWRDAGATVTVQGATGSLTLDRFTGPNGEIYYFSSTGNVAAIQPDAAYAVAIDGSTAPNGVAAATITGALQVPSAIVLYGPDFTQVPATVTRSVPLDVSWDAGDAAAVVTVRLAVVGTGGAVTLVCSTPDDGGFEIAASQLRALPTGPGTLTVSRTRVTRSPLGSTSLEATATLVEGGAIVLP